MGLLKVIEWQDNTRNTLVYKVDMKGNFIARGSKLTVRDSQAAIFCDKGKMADVFLPGMYTLDTNNVPLLTKLMSWKYGFESPFKSDVYFVSTRQFPNEKWGTTNPIILRDADYGAIRIRSYGTYSFRVSDPYIFMQQLAGTGSSYRTEDIRDYLRSMIVTGITDAIGESKVPVLDLAGNLLELGKIVTVALNKGFREMGLELVRFNLENFSLPPELEKAFDKNAAMGMTRQNMDVYTQMAAADALRDAAKNPGMGGTVMGMGMGAGMGVAMGGMMGGMMNQAAPATQPGGSAKCSKCGTAMAATAKFCPNCGQANGSTCSKCKAVINAGAKFCPNCGQPTAKSCPKCKIAVSGNFCPNCGTKVE